MPFIDLIAISLWCRQRRFSLSRWFSLSMPLRCCFHDYFRHDYFITLIYLMFLIDFLIIYFRLFYAISYLYYWYLMPLLLIFSLHYYIFLFSLTPFSPFHFLYIFFAIIFAAILFSLIISFWSLADIAFFHCHELFPHLDAVILSLRWLRHILPALFAAIDISAIATLSPPFTAFFFTVYFSIIFAAYCRRLRYDAWCLRVVAECYVYLCGCRYYMRVYDCHFITPMIRLLRYFAAVYAADADAAAFADDDAARFAAAAALRFMPFTPFSPGLLWYFIIYYYWLLFSLIFSPLLFIFSLLFIDFSDYFHCLFSLSLITDYFAASPLDDYCHFYFLWFHYIDIITLYFIFIFIYAFDLPDICIDYFRHFHFHCHYLLRRFHWYFFIWLLPLDLIFIDAFILSDAVGFLSIIFIGFHWLVFMLCFRYYYLFRCHYYLIISRLFTLIIFAIAAAIIIACRWFIADAIIFFSFSIFDYLRFLWLRHLHCWLLMPDMVILFMLSLLLLCHAIPLIVISLFFIVFTFFCHVSNAAMLLCHIFSPLRFRFREYWACLMPRVDAAITPLPIISMPFILIRWWRWFFAMRSLIFLAIAAAAYWLFLHYAFMPFHYFDDAFHFLRFAAISIFAISMPRCLITLPPFHIIYFRRFAWYFRFVSICRFRLLRRGERCRAHARKDDIFLPRVRRLLCACAVHAFFATFHASFTFRYFAAYWCWYDGDITGNNGRRCAYLMLICTHVERFHAAMILMLLPCRWYYYAAIWIPQHAVVFTYCHACLLPCLRLMIFAADYFDYCSPMAIISFTIFFDGFRHYFHYADFLFRHWLISSSLPFISSLSLSAFASLIFFFRFEAFFICCQRWYLMPLIIW